MLTNEQCIRVATELWGWEKSEAKGYFYKNLGNCGDHGMISKSALIREVNSWQGFGRTVEAMDVKNYTIQILGGDVKFLHYSDIPSIDPNPLYFKLPRHIIEATHLAALEALKNDE